MGKRAGARTKSPVDQYRKQLGKHEKHMATSKSRFLKVPKHTDGGGSTVDVKYALQVVLALVLLLAFIAVIYFIGFMGVVQLLYDAVEMVSSYWRGATQMPKDKTS